MLIRLVCALIVVVRVVEYLVAVVVIVVGIVAIVLIHAIVFAAVVIVLTIIIIILIVRGHRVTISVVVGGVRVVVGRRNVMMKMVFGVDTGVRCVVTVVVVVRAIYIIVNGRVRYVAERHCRAGHGLRDGIVVVVGNDAVIGHWNGRHVAVRRMRRRIVHYGRRNG